MRGKKQRLAGNSIKAMPLNLTEADMELFNKSHNFRKQISPKSRLNGGNPPFMVKALTLRQKTCLAVAATLTGVLGVLYATSSTLLLSSIQTAEEQNTRQAVEGVLSIFAQTQVDFSDRFPDWSAWDDTYTFIQNGKPTNYIASNLTPEALASMKVNLVLYINSRGRLVYGTGLDRKSKQKIPLPEALQPHIAAASPLLRAPNRANILTGFLLLPSGPMLVTSQPILTSRGTGPMRGTLIFGRYLDTDRMQKLASRYRLTVYEINAPQLAPDFVTAREDLLTKQTTVEEGDKFSSSAAGTIVVRPLNERESAGYTIIEDIYGEPALLLRVDVPREIYQQGITNLRYLSASLVIVGLVFGPLAQLGLEKLFRIQQQRRESEIRYWTVVAQASEGICLIDAKTKRFLEANMALENLLSYSLKELLQLTLYDVLVEDRATIDREIQEILTAKQHFTGEQQYLCQDGRVVDVEVNANHIAYAERDVLCMVVRDITARKQAEKALREQAQKEEARNRVLHTIRNSLDLTTIFSTAVYEIGKLLQAERATIMEYLQPQEMWQCMAEYRKRSDLPTGLGLELLDGNPIANRVGQGEIIRIDDARKHEDKVVQSLAQTYPGAWLFVPLQLDDRDAAHPSSCHVWGSLNLLRHSQPSPWQDWEVELACAVADQLAIAIQQSELYLQVQQLNADLETQVIERTGQLEEALSYESTLKRITDKVRDSLDEAQILQTAVEELALSLGVQSCDAALYDLERRTSTIFYEYNRPEIPSAQGLTFPMDNWPDIYNQLLQGQYVQCCITSLPVASILSSKLEFAILSCPMMDDRGVLGDIWLLKQKEDWFNDLEIRLVQQVANQCAIAIRQARLYQATQAQVEELERLNRLKDDFLSTVSHELRTPMSNIKMATQMLEVVLKQAGIFDAPNKAVRYFKILHDECQRETNLINDLLDLSRLDAGAESLVLSTVDPKISLLNLAELFAERTQSQKQKLKIDLPAELPALTTDLSKLERVLTELLNNACKYTPAGEKITITAQVKHETNGSSLLFSVKNSGVEIPPSELNHIFDKFYRVPKNDPWKHGGTGLGLALVQKLVTHLGGSISVESDAGEICFTVQLPIG